MQKHREPPPPLYPIGSVDNALRLLLRLRDEPVLRLSDVAAGLGVANSTAHRLLAMMQYHGFVQRDSDTRAYQVGPVLAEIGLEALRHRDVRAWARPALEAAASELDETIHLGVLESNRVRYLDAIESTRAVRVAARTGRSLPAHCTSIGKALLAGLTDDDLTSLIGPGPLARETAASLTSPAKLVDDLRKTGRRGYALNAGESEDGVVSVAVPIRDRSGMTVAALSCAAPENRMPPERVGEVADVLAMQVRRRIEDPWTP